MDDNHFTHSDKAALNKFVEKYLNRPRSHFKTIEDYNRFIEYKQEIGTDLDAINGRV